MKISIALDPRFDPDEVTTLGQAAEAYGIDTVWLPNLLDSRDQYASLTRLAGSTSTIGAGVAAVSPWETHPAKTALALLSLNQAARGRARIVISGGGELTNFLHLKTNRRIRAVRECIEILKLGSADEPHSYDGEIFQVDEFHPRWATASPPCVLVAANEPQMLRVTAQVADGVMAAVLPPPFAKAAVDTLKGHLVQFGRPVDDFRFDNWWPWHIKSDPEAANREARQWLGYQGIFRPQILTSFMSEAEYAIVEANRGNFYQAAHQNRHRVEGVPDGLIQRIIDNVTSTGGIDDLEQKMQMLREFSASGLTDLTLRLYGDPAEHAASIALIGERVLPSLE